MIYSTNIAIIQQAILFCWIIKIESKTYLHPLKFLTTLNNYASLICRIKRIKEGYIPIILQIRDKIGLFFIPNL